MAAVEINFTSLLKRNKSIQIAQQIRLFITKGTLKSGDQLPATRTMAYEIGVARGTIVTAIEALIAEGYLISHTGIGTFVSDDCSLLVNLSIPGPTDFPLPNSTVSADIDAPTKCEINFLACRPSLEAFPRNAWRKAAANAASILPNADYDDPRGDKELRQIIADYLRRARGLGVKSDEIIITNGAIQAMHILAKIYLQKDDAVAFEEPGYPLARQIFSMAGAKIINVPVDKSGMKVDELPEDGGNIKLVYVTPSHQFPTGQRLSLGRRSYLLEWAARHDALIVEDDYDGEFRYDCPALPPMAAMGAKNHVVYFGTFSKTLFPSLRLGYAIAPKEVIKAMAAYRAITDYHTNTLSQLTLKAFIVSGAFEKHILKMRRIYADKRKCLKQAIAQENFPGKLEGIDSGLNGLVKLTCKLSALEVSQYAAVEGLSINPISRYWNSEPEKDDALVVGYSGLSTFQIEIGIRKLKEIIHREENKKKHDNGSVLAQE